MPGTGRAGCCRDMNLFIQQTLCCQREQSQLQAGGKTTRVGDIICLFYSFAIQFRQAINKAFEHQHLNEIGQSVKQLQPGFDHAINFIPYRGDFTRGIIASIYVDCNLGEAEALRTYQQYYAGHPFTHVTNHDIDLKQVVNTNKCIIQVKKHGNKLLIISIIDNLLKGASGQAVQNMNLMFGFDEKAGLKLKATAF